MNVAYLLLVAFGAQIFGTIAGFGSATVLTPFASYFVNMKAAIALVAFFHLFGNASKVLVFRKKIDFKLFLQFGIPSILLTFGGAYLASHLETPFIRWIFGWFLTIYVLVSLIHPSFGLKPSIKASLFGGAASGFVAGLIGTGGAIRSAFLSSFHLDKEVYIVTSAAIACLIDLTRIPVYVAGGALTGLDTMTLIPLLILVAYVGTKVGKKFVHFVPQKVFQKIVLGVLFLAGIHFIWRGY